jgi:ribosomal protein S18 acetylase RimI-like enzyme
MSMSVDEIRAASESDTQRIVELSLAAWAPVFDSFRSLMGETLYQRVHPDWEADQATSVRDALARHTTWVAVTAGRVCGFVNVNFDDAARAAEIYMIAVDPSAQRSGIGSRLTEYAIAEMRDRDIDLAIVATGGDPGHAPARRTYEKAGFTGVPQVWYTRLVD